MVRARAVEVVGDLQRGGDVEHLGREEPEQQGDEGAPHLAGVGDRPRLVGRGGRHEPTVRKVRRRRLGRMRPDLRGWGRDEVDELLHCADERGVEVGEARDVPEEHPPELAGRGPDPEAGDDALLPRLAHRYDGPGVDAGGLGAHRLPHVDVRRAGHEHVGMAHGGRHAGLLGAVDQVVEQHAEALSRAGTEGVDHGGKVVHPVEAFDDDPLDPQVVAPHLLDQLGVVDPLDEDAAGARHPGLRADRGRARRGAARRCGRPCRARGHQRDRPPPHAERARVGPDQAAAAGVAVLDGDAAVLEPDHRALDAGRPVQDLEALVPSTLG